MFGTVSGMSEIFGSQSPGGTNPQQLAHGISIALYNTAFGIAIVKAYLVCTRFMHLNIEKKWVAYILAFMILMMVVFFAGVSPDVLKSTGHNWEKTYVEPAAGAAHTHQEKHVMDYVRIVYKRRWVAGPVFLLVFALGAVNALRETPVYQAHTQLMIETDQPKVAKLDQMGELVRVKDGFARNFLLPRGKALRATEANKKKFEDQRAQLEARNLERRSEAEKVGETLNGKSFVLIRQAGETGQLYGSVSNRDIAQAVTAAGFTVDRRQVLLLQPIDTGAVDRIR